MVRFWLGLLALSLCTPAAAAAGGWPAFGADPARTNAAPDNATLTPANVSRLHLQWRVRLGSVADSAPIVDSGLLFITGTDGTTYAIYPASGHTAWRFQTHGPKITTSVPVADPNGKWLFVPGVDGFVRRLDLRSGREVHGDGFPLQISKMTETEKDASALNLANGYLYAATSGYDGDAPPYDGHVVAMRLSNGSVHVFNSLCSNVHALPTAETCPQSDSGIWSRAGVVVDPDPAMGARVYVSTGNGAFDANRGGHDYGDSVIALSADGSKVLSSFTPSNYAQLEAEDLDLGSSAPALLPRDARSRTPLMAVIAGKDGTLYLLDREHLGGVGGAIAHSDLGEPLFSAPAVWRNRNETVVFLGLSDGVRAYRLETGKNGRSSLVHLWTTPAGNTQEGTTPVVSNGVIYFATSGALYALDAKTGRKLWTGDIGPIHWQSPIVVNDRVYCADENGDLSAFSLTR